MEDIGYGLMVRVWVNSQVIGLDQSGGGATPIQAKWIKLDL